MKRFTTNMTLAVAALTLAAGTASAQAMKAEIPFTFRVGNTVMQPGEYLVTVVSHSSLQIVQFATADVKHSALAVPVSRSAVPKEWRNEGLPKLRFACYNGPCSVVGLWMGDSSTLDFSSGHRKDGEPRIAEIALHRDRAGD
jgi:hypothetical protein